MKSKMIFVGAWIESSLHQQAVKTAAKEDRSFSSLVRRALKQTINERRTDDA